MKISMSLLEILAVVFIILKLTGIIHWSWWFVLMPLWIPAAITFVLFLVFLVMAIFATVFNL